MTSFDTHDASVRFEGFAEALADCGGLAARLVELHHSDENGRCVVCSSNQSARSVFPCRLRSAATRALVIQAQRISNISLPNPGLFDRPKG